MCERPCVGDASLSGRVWAPAMDCIHLPALIRAPPPHLAPTPCYCVPSTRPLVCLASVDTLVSLPTCARTEGYPRARGACRRARNRLVHREHDAHFTAFAAVPRPRTRRRSSQRRRRTRHKRRRRRRTRGRGRRRGRSRLKRWKRATCARSRVAIGETGMCMYVCAYVRMCICRYVHVCM